MIEQYIGSKLNRQLALVILVAFLVCGALYFAVAYGMEVAVCAYYDRRPEIIREKAAERLDALQTFVFAEQVSATDHAALSAWVARSPLMVLQIHQGSRLVFDSTTQSSVALHTHLSEHSPSTTQLVRTITFPGGDAQVSIAVFPEHTLVAGLSKALLVFCSALFLGITLWSVQKKVRYLVQLEQEVLAIAGGELTLPITSHGADELALLAGCIDEMRHSLIERLKQEEARQQERHTWIASLSHDIRTPLTALSGYLEVLRMRPLPEAERRYVEKCMEKAAQLKQMTDMLFACFASNAPLAEAPQAVSSDTFIRDYVLGLAERLRDNGFQVALSQGDPACPALMLHPAAARRVFDNVTENILRYANPSAPVRIDFSDNTPGGLTVTLQSVPNTGAPIHGTGLGLSICQNLMEHMQGTFATEASPALFTYRLKFACTTNQ